MQWLNGTAWDISHPSSRADSIMAWLFPFPLFCAYVLIIRNSFFILGGGGGAGIFLVGSGALDIDFHLFPFPFPLRRLL